MKSLNQRQVKINRILAMLKRETSGMAFPMSVRLVEDFGKDPFLILIACLLSLRSRDSVTYPVAKKLFAQVKTPHDLASFPTPALEALLKSIGGTSRRCFNYLSCHDTRAHHRRCWIYRLPLSETARKAKRISHYAS